MVKVDDGKTTTLATDMGNPTDVALVGNNVFVCCQGQHCIRAVHLDTGDVIDVAGRPGHQGNADGDKSKATLNFPTNMKPSKKTDELFISTVSSDQTDKLIRGVTRDGSLRTVKRCGR